MPYGIQYNETQIPEWLKKSFEEIASRSTGISKAPQDRYGRQRIAGTNPFMQGAQNLGRATGLHEPLLDRAAQGYTQYSDSFPGNADAYMNPYRQRVVDRISELGGRTFNERILPALEAKFVRQGTYGGSQHQQMALRAARDLQDEIMGRQSAALSEGYKDSANQFNLDRARQLEANKGIAALGPMYQGGRLSDIANQMALGEHQQTQEQAPLDMAYQDFLRQQSYPMEQLTRHANIISGVPIPVSQQGVNYESPKPQLNTAGQLGSLATSMLGASMMGGQNNFFSNLLGGRR